MGEGAQAVGRAGRELFEATREFAVESRARSWWCVCTTFGLLAIAIWAAALIPWWPLRLGASVLAGLLFVRAFILFHDYMHGSLLRGSRLARVIFYVYGLVALTPPGLWRHSHNYHHANVGKPLPPNKDGFSLLTTDVGAFALMSTDLWQRATSWQRFRYRLGRHPLVILCAYVTVFLGNQCLAPFLRNPRKSWEGGLSLLAHGTLVFALGWFAGFSMLFFAFLLPFAIAAASGAYLFFAQHNYKGMRIVPLEEWTHDRGALESSSYMRLGPILCWFTGNIGFHHVHHLNAQIPFYNLPRAMAAIPELQHPCVTTLRPSDILSCLRLNLWDLGRGQLVSYREASRSFPRRTEGGTSAVSGDV